MAQFFYSREQIVKKKDEKGAFIPIMRDVVDPNNPTNPPIKEAVPGQFETETKIRTDSFNTDNVIRTHMIDEDHVIVLLNDGHETTEKVPVLKNKLKPAHPSNIIEEKTRVWIQSEISLKGEDVKRYFDQFNK